MLSYVIPSRETASSNHNVNNDAGMSSNRTNGNQVTSSPHTLRLNLQIESADNEPPLNPENASGTDAACTPDLQSKHKQLPSRTLASTPSQTRFNCKNGASRNYNRLPNIKSNSSNEDAIANNDGSIMSNMFHENSNTCNDIRSNSDKQLQISNPRQTMTKKPKLTKLGTKTVGLKRVSFGSSKGSMVETLVFETPTPLSEQMEPGFGFECDDGQRTHPHNSHCKSNLDDSGIEIQEELERSIVRVSIYQSKQPQQICPPEYLSKFDDCTVNGTFLANYNLDNIMTASPLPGYDRQQSVDSGWDNPFRPGGDLSREADEIVKMISGGKAITPTDDHNLANGKGKDTTDGAIISEDIPKTNVSQQQTAPDSGGDSQKLKKLTTTATAKTADKNGGSSMGQISKQVVPGPTSASHVIIEEKKDKKNRCCVVQ